VRDTAAVLQLAEHRRYGDPGPVESCVHCQDEAPRRLRALADGYIPPDREIARRLDQDLQRRGVIRGSFFS
jgi:hypothetical protein